MTHAVPLLLSHFGLRPWELDLLTGAEIDALGQYLKKMREAGNG